MLAHPVAQECPQDLALSVPYPTPLGMTRDRQGTNSSLLGLVPPHGRKLATVPGHLQISKDAWEKESISPPTPLNEQETFPKSPLWTSLYASGQNCAIRPH